ncbi:MAG TPA: hypothetical protein VFB63_34235 [Bryobacteraceae bacterium]|jgi:hypothetical protein|nr:hypothetical protein [Bryobacteraceae bacterium]
MTRSRLYIALASFGALALASTFLLRGETRMVILIFLAGLGVKSWIAYKKETLP